MKTITILFWVMAAAIVLLNGCGQPEALNETIVTDTEFIAAEKWDDTASVYVETENESKVIPTYEVGFVRAEAGETDVRLVERDLNNIYEVTQLPTYLLLVPEDKIKNMSKNYAKTFNETLEFTESETED